MSTVTDSDKTKLERLLTLHPKAHVVIRAERLIAYERVIEEVEAVTVTGPHRNRFLNAIRGVRALEPKDEAS